VRNIWHPKKITFPLSLTLGWTSWSCCPFQRAGCTAKFSTAFFPRKGKEGKEKIVRPQPADEADLPPHELAAAAAEMERILEQEPHLSDFGFGLADCTGVERCVLMARQYRSTKMDERQQDRLDKAFQEWRAEEDRFDKAFQELRAEGPSSWTGRDRGLDRPSVFCCDSSWTKTSTIETFSSLTFLNGQRRSPARSGSGPYQPTEIANKIAAALPSCRPAEVCRGSYFQRH
jgi:hypothetical protein